MKIFRSPLEASRLHPGAVVAIGKFDGMHRGHLKLLRAAVRRARQLKTDALVLTFDPDPAEFLRLYPYRPLMPLAQRLERFAKLGIEAVVLLPFDQELACLSPEAFARDVLAVQLKPVAICVGTDFCFGKDRAGTVADLKAFGAKHGFLVEPVTLLKAGGEKITAERVRALLSKGRTRAARALLGRKVVQ